MTVKPHGDTLKIKEQIIEDPVTGLTLCVRAKRDGQWGPYLTGSVLEFGNRDFHFSAEGEMAGSGTGLCCSLPPNWLEEVEP